MRELNLQELESLKEKKRSFALYVRSELKKDKIKELFDTEIVVPELEKVFGGRLEFYSINADNHKDILRDFRLPSLVLFKEGSVFRVFEGIQAWSEYMEGFSELLGG